MQAAPHRTVTGCTAESVAKLSESGLDCSLMQNAGPRQDMHADVASTCGLSEFAAIGAGRPEAGMLGGANRPPWPKPAITGSGREPRQASGPDPYFGLPHSKAPFGG